MWSWFQTLRSCFGTSQKQSESPPPEPVNQTEGPLATSRRNELVPELPTAQSSRGDRLHWGQYVAPNTPGSQREEVLRPLASSGTDVVWEMTEAFKAESSLIMINFNNTEPWISLQSVKPPIWKRKGEKPLYKGAHGSIRIGCKQWKKHTKVCIAFMTSPRAFLTCTQSLSACVGLRNRYATQPERHEIGVIRDLSESPAYLSARASDLSQPSAIELAILEREGLDTRQSPTSQCNYHLQPTNLESKLTAEGGVQPRTLHKSHDPKPRHHQHPPPHIVARTVRSGIPDQTILGCSQRSLSTPRSARLGRHNQPYHAVQASLTQRQPPDGRQKNIANGRSRVQTPRGSSPPKPVAEDRAQKGKLSRSASPLTLKRKSTNISASPSSALKGKRDGIGVSPQRVASARPHVPPLNLKQQDKSRASPRPRWVQAN